MNNLYVFIAIVGTLLRLEPCAFAQNPGPGPLTITVSGATVTSDSNYYLVQVPDDDEPATTIHITGGGNLPSLDQSMFCTCSYNGATAPPDPDGNPVYTFTNEKQVGTQDENGTGQNIDWDVDSNTTPDEYKFTVTNKKQNYLSCTGSWANGSTIATQENSEASPTITILAYRIKTECQADTPSEKDRENIGAGETVVATFEPSRVVNWSIEGDSLEMVTQTDYTFTFHTVSNITAWEGYATMHLKATIKDTDTEAKEFYVIMPNEETVSSQTNLQSFPSNSAGAGMDLQIQVGPTDVSFAGVKCKEIGGPAENVYGYFARVGGDHAHKEPKASTQLTSSNKWSDIAAMGYYGTGYPPPWAWGYFDWAIPVRWISIWDEGLESFDAVSSAEDSALTGQSGIPDRCQEFTMVDSSGTVTISKLGASVSRTP